MSPRASSPRLLLAGAVVALAALLALPPATDAKRRGCAQSHVAPAQGNLAQVRSAVLCLHNRARAARGLPRLTEHRALRSAAEEHSAHMVGARFFAHDAPGGDDLVDRILGTGYADGQGWALGENIAWGTGRLATPAAIHRAWMRSPGHRANILRREFREIGIGIALGAPVADGGNGATYTADFGVRR